MLINVLQASLLDDRLSQVVTNLNSSIQKVQRILVFSVNGSSGQIVINVANKESGDILRQVHSEGVLQVTKEIVRND